MAGINIRRTKMQQKDALDRGANQADKYGKNVEKLIGNQKVNLAAQGIDISSGSAADTLKETADLGYADVQRIQTNAFREALGYGLQQTDYEANRIMDQASAQTRQTSTLLNGLVTGAKYLDGSFGSGKTGGGTTNYNYGDDMNSIDSQLRF